jgi:hypothetical protein
MCWCYSCSETTSCQQQHVTLGAERVQLCQLHTANRITESCPPLCRHADNEALKLAKDCQPISYPKPDGETTFDLPTSLFRSGGARLQCQL